MRAGLEIRVWLGALAVAVGSGMVPPAFADDPPEWSTPVKPFRIAGNVYYVGTKGLAAYLIVANRGAILLNGTTAGNARLMAEHRGRGRPAVRREATDQRPRSR